MGLDVLNLNIRYDYFIGNYVLRDAAVYFYINMAHYQHAKNSISL